MDYGEQLKDDRWYARRAEILERDGYCCQDCLRSKRQSPHHLQLQVHHKEYLDGLMAWEYPDELLITLCRGCHARTHGIIEEYVPRDRSQDRRSHESRPVLHIRDAIIEFIKSISRNG